MKISFTGYHSPLKTAWKQGKLPSVTKGIYGKTLTQDTLSLEHIVPHSMGGVTQLNNLFLADAKANRQRGLTPIMEVITYEQLFDYLYQFIDVKTKKFNGNDYIIQILKKIGGLKK